MHRDHLHLSVLKHLLSLILNQEDDAEGDADLDKLSLQLFHSVKLINDDAADAELQKCIHLQPQLLLCIDFCCVSHSFLHMKLSLRLNLLKKTLMHDENDQPHLIEHELSIMLVHKQSSLLLNDRVILHLQLEVVKDEDSKDVNDEDVEVHEVKVQLLILSQSGGHQCS